VLLLRQSLAKQSVGLYCGLKYLTCPHKLEYCEKAGTEGQSAPRVGTGETPRYRLAHQDNNVDFGGGSNEIKQVVEWEFQAYIADALSSKQIDNLKIWQVSNVVNSHGASDTDRLL
jgi:hypothetical protein